MADKEGMERKVYLLPAELVERIRAYQTAQNIPSEVEAARRLLDNALQMRDTAASILDKLAARFKEDRDLRVLNRDVLSTHPLVTTVRLVGDTLFFKLTDESCGQIDRRGFMEKGDSENYMEQYPKPKPPAAKVASWDAGRGGGDLDDEIPF